MSTKEMNFDEERMTITMTERADELLRMVLNLKQSKEVDLHRLQTLILNMYRDEAKLIHIVGELIRESESEKRKIIDIPKFMYHREDKEAQ